MNRRLDKLTNALKRQEQPDRVPFVELFEQDDGRLLDRDGNEYSADGSGFPVKGYIGISPDDWD